MAEIVQFHLEENLPELHEMEQLKLFNRTELKQIIRRRRTFEYKLQRSAKTKKDYLKCIEYEIALLKLIRARIKRLSIKSIAKINVQKTIGRKIRSLYKQVLVRYKSDVKLWQMFLTFLQEMKWKTMVSKEYAAMLKFHSDKPELWINASRWEFDEFAATPLARKALLKGIRFNPDSKPLHQELFDLELRHAEIEFKLAEEEKSKRDKEEEKSEGENEMPVDPDLRLAETVYKNAINTIDDVQYAVGFIEICDKYHFASSLSESICTNLQDKFKDNEIWRKTWAMRPLHSATNSEKSTEDFPEEQMCLDRFEEAVESVPTETMWIFYLEFALERLKLDSRSLKNKKQLHDRTLSLISRASSDHRLSPSLFQQWANLALKEDGHLHGKVLRYAIKRFPKIASFWEDRFQHGLKSGFSNNKIQTLIDKGLLSISSNEVLNFWKKALLWLLVTYSDQTKIEEFFEDGLKKHLSIASHIKVWYLEWVCAERDYEATWKLYKRIWSIPPISIESFQKMYDIILSTPKPSIKRLRKVMIGAQSNFGKNNVDVWIQSMDAEKYATIENNQSSILYQRAIRTLSPELVDQFITYHTLKTTNIQDS